MVKNEEEKGRKKTITISVTFLEDPNQKKPPDARVYLFDSAGRLLDSKPVGKESLSFQVASDQNYRFTLGPDLLERARYKDLASALAKAKAISQDYLAVIGRDKLSFHVLPAIYGCWYQVCIFVHGSVRKRLNPGGDPPQYSPICTGTVQIFQVDLGCTLDNMASFTAGPFLSNLISKLKGLEFTPIPIPHIDPGDPGPLRRRAEAMTKRQVRSTERAKVTDVSARLDVAAASTASGNLKGAATIEEAIATLSVLDLEAAKKYIIASKVILWPFLCLLIPDEAFCWQELGETLIQSDGTFSAEVCFWCPDDFPDLYFEVIQTIDGVDREISDPQIACSTYYNYNGSRSVDIVVDDPNAIACLPTPNPGPSYLYVWPTAIGNIDLRDIDGLETPGFGTGLLPGSTGPRPWGGTLCLQMQFHPDLQAHNIRYYRWSYKFSDEAEFTQVHGTVTHRWKHVTFIPPSTIDINLVPVTFGPLPATATIAGTTNLFGVPDASLPWVDIVDPYDRPFAYFDSTEGIVPRKSGRCRLKLEMFDGNGNHVACDNHSGGPTFKYLLPKLGGALDEYTNAPDANITAEGDLIFDIRVDNYSTDAELTGVTTPVGAADLCGFLQYGALDNNVAIKYVAYHPSNFLDWKLWVSRGLSGVVVQDPPPPPPLPVPPGYAPTNTSAGSPGSPVNFNNTAGTLLGTCPRAAFAVNLYIWARATDGYERLQNYDASATIAFALTHS
jgi:hypothetical protein